MTQHPPSEPRDGLALHETALAIHRSPSLSRACRTLAGSLLENGLIRGFRPPLGIGDPSPRTDLLVAPADNRFDADDDAHLAEFVI